MNTDEFDFLKESIALRAEALKMEFRSFFNDLERENVLERLASEAESLGYRIGREGMSVPAILIDDQLIGGPADYGHAQGFETFVSVRYQAEHCSQEARDRLSRKEQEQYMEEFHSLCAQGIGENCRFYRLLMDRYLHNLVVDARAHCGTGRAELLTNREISVDRGRVPLER